MKARYVFVVTLLTLLPNLLSGCATYRPRPPIPPGDISAEYIKDLSAPDLLTKYNRMTEDNAADIQAKADRRNQILQEFIWLIDQNYGSFEEHYYGSDASVNFWSDTLNLGLTGAAAVTGTTHLKSILSAVATGETGIKTSFLKNFYDSQTRAAVVQEMRALRATQLSTLQDQNHMKASIVPAHGVAAYSLEQGLSDIDAYYDAGTIIGALQAIAKSAGTAQDAATKQQHRNSAAPQLF